MKKIFRDILVTVSLCSATSCGDFIEVEPEDDKKEQLVIV